MPNDGLLGPVWTLAQTLGWVIYRDSKIVDELAPGGREFAGTISEDMEPDEAFPQLNGWKPIIVGWTFVGIKNEFLKKCRQWLIRTTVLQDSERRRLNPSDGNFVGFKWDTSDSQADIARVVSRGSHVETEWRAPLFYVEDIQRIWRPIGSATNDDERPEFETTTELVFIPLNTVVELFSRKYDRTGGETHMGDGLAYLIKKLEKESIAATGIPFEGGVQKKIQPEDLGDLDFNYTRNEAWQKSKNNKLPPLYRSGVGWAKIKFKRSDVERLFCGAEAEQHGSTASVKSGKTIGRPKKWFEPLVQALVEAYKTPTETVRLRGFNGNKLMKTAQNLVLDDLTKDECTKRFGRHTFDTRHFIEGGLNKARDEALNRINAIPTLIREA